MCCSVPGRILVHWWRQAGEGWACALTHCDLQPPSGQAFQSDVAEIFGVRDGRIVSLDIYVDSAPYPKQRPQEH
jgi:ketosteroid isomerase-like protein